MPDTVTIGQFVRMLLQQWRILALTLVVACAVGAGWWAVQPSVYRASASVDITSDADSDVPPAAISAATERDVILSQAVAKRAATALRRTQPHVSAATVRHSVSATSQGGSRLLRIVYRGPSARAAADGANAVATAYLGLRADLSRQRLASREATVRADLNRALAVINDLPVDQGVQRAYAQSEVKRLTAEISALHYTAVDSGQLIDRAEPSPAQAPSVLVYLVGALLVGLLLGVPVAAVAERARYRRSRS